MSQVYYYKICLKIFLKKYTFVAHREKSYANSGPDIEFQKKLYLCKVVPYLNKQCNIHDAGVFYPEVCKLEAMYKELLESDNILYTFRVTRFSDRFQDALPSFQQEMLKRCLTCYVFHVKSMIFLKDEIISSVVSTSNTFQSLF